MKKADSGRSAREFIVDRKDRYPWDLLRNVDLFFLVATDFLFFFVHDEGARLGCRRIC